MSAHPPVKGLRALLRAGGRGRAAVQVCGFVAGLAILAWCVSLALSPENRAQLESLANAPPHLAAALLALCVLSLLLNGAAFWTIITPVRRVPLADVQAVNALASFLTYLPFKLSVVARFIIHHRRNGVPLLTIGAWMAAFGIAMLASLAPPVGGAVWRHGVDAYFAVAVVLGMLVMYGATLAAARLLAFDAGLRRVHRLTDPVPGLRRIARTPAFHHLHDGFGMLAHPAGLGATMSLRCLDLLVQAARFVIAARIVGAELSWEGAILAACTYFIIGVVSPTGSLGTREGGATGLAALLAIPGFSEQGFVVIALTVSGAELVVQFAAAAVSLAWLRPWSHPRPGGDQGDEGKS